MTDTESIHTPPDYQACPSHAGMLLRIAVREAERMLCPICAQEARKRVYAASRAEWQRRSGSGLAGPDGPCEAIQRQAGLTGLPLDRVPGIASEGGGMGLPIPSLGDEITTTTRILPCPS